MALKSDVRGVAPTVTSMEDAAGAHDLRQEDDASASTYMGGATILSSMPSSTPTPTPTQDGGTISIRVSDTLSLSLNASMVDSSVLAETGNSSGYWVELERAAFSHSSISSSASASISSIDTSFSEQPAAPGGGGLFGAIGRSLVLASVSTDSDSSSSGSSCGSEVGFDAQKSLEGYSSKKTKWYEHLQTDEDWDRFRAQARDCLNAIVAEEMKQLRRNDCGTGDVQKKLGEMPSLPRQTNQGFLRWLVGIYDSINATIAGLVSRNGSERTNVFSSLVQESVDIKTQLSKLPPMPPSLPEDLSLNGLPSESRNMLVQYRESLNAWRNVVMPRQKELSDRYVRCQEKLLAIIIDDRSEDMFNGDKDECCKGDSLGKTNDDGYFEVMKKESVRWDEVSEALAVSQSKCQLASLGTAFFAVLAAGASVFFALQSKRK